VPGKVADLTAGIDEAGLFLAGGSKAHEFHWTGDTFV
jgi:hypothetical protein